MKSGYARVSSIGQELESQILKLKEENCDKIYSEKFTGTKKERPEFQKLLADLNEGDVLIVTKLDRFARSASDGINIIKDLFSRGIKVHVLNLGIIEDSTSGRLILNIMLSFAEFERDLIAERMSEGKAVAKMNPEFRDGRPPKFTRAQIQHALELLKDHSYRDVELMTGISKSTLIRAKKRRGN